MAVFKIAFLRKDSVKYYDYIVKWSNGVACKIVVCFAAAFALHCMYPDTSKFHKALTVLKSNKICVRTYVAWRWWGEGVLQKALDS